MLIHRPGFNRHPANERETGADLGAHAKTQPVKCRRLLIGTLPLARVINEVDHKVAGRARPASDRDLYRSGTIDSG